MIISFVGGLHHPDSDHSDSKGPQAHRESRPYRSLDALLAQVTVCNFQVSSSQGGLSQGGKMGMISINRCHIISIQMSISETGCHTNMKPNLKS